MEKGRGLDAEPQRDGQIVFLRLNSSLIDCKMRVLATEVETQTKAVFSSSSSRELTEPLSHFAFAKTTSGECYRRVVELLSLIDAHTSR